MSANQPDDAQVPKTWTTSNTIKFLLISWASGISASLLAMFAARSFDWWVLGGQTVAALIPALVRMGKSDFYAPAPVSAVVKVATLGTVDLNANTVRVGAGGGPKP